MTIVKIFAALVIVLSLLVFYSMSYRGFEREIEEDLIAEKIDFISEEEKLENRFLRRNKIYRRACSALPLIQNYLLSNSSFDTLLHLHRKIHNTETPLPEIPKAACITNNIPQSSVFNLTESMDLLICLPPKAGTSNWQRALDVHYLNLTQGWARQPWKRTLVRF